MSQKKYKVTLTEDEETLLYDIINKGKHRSWLNMAEIELNGINNYGLSARIPTRERMRKEAVAWNLIRYKKTCTINWRFTTADARIKLQRLYPKFE
jgi:hypothetical protein